jgi:hypothetical protein
MLKKMMIAMSGSGGIADEYGGKYIDERKRIKILKRKNPQKAVHDIIIFKNQVHANNKK